MVAARPWWDPARHAERRPYLLARNRIQAAIRQWFAKQGFIEVDPSALQRSPGNETHLHAFATAELGLDGTRKQALYLHTSPEFAMKKLLAAGESRIFAFAHAYRNRERSRLHHPEFVMLEWYRAGAGYEQLMQDCAELLRVAADGAQLSHRGVTVDPALDPERLTVAEAFRRDAGIDLLASLGDTAALRGAVAATGLRTAPDDSWADLFARVLADRVEPKLGRGRATLLTEYPISEAALARPSPRDPRVAERFELYACGVELANAFGELTDPAEQRRRFEADMATRERLYGERYPLDEEFLTALGTMPQASGIALGFDRLVMLAAGAERIEQVLWAPVPDA